MRNYNQQEIPVDSNVLEESPIHGELNIEQLVFRQIERTYLSATQDESLFAANVRLLLATVPSHKRTEILERSDEYTSTVEKYQYKYCCNVPLGTPEEPVNGSPFLVTEEVIDWHQLFEIILKAFQDCNLTWKFEKWTIEIGKVNNTDTIAPPTPTFEDKFKRPNVLNELSETASKPTVDQKPQKQMRPCSICSKHVEKGTGLFYNHKLVHKEQCLDLAKMKWGMEDT